MIARIAVVGAGWWSSFAHLPALAQHVDADVVALCDLDIAKARGLAADFGNPAVFGDVAEMLARVEPDAVVISTTHASHHAVASVCLEAGCHVLIEKPMTLRAADAVDLERLASEADRQIVMGYTFNEIPAVDLLRTAVRSGELGTPLFVHGAFVSEVRQFLSGDADFRDGVVRGPGNVYADPARSGGGHGYLQMTHLFGLLFYIADLEIARVSALMGTRDLTVDIVNAFSVEFADGTFGSFGGTGDIEASAMGRNSIEIIYTQGSAAFSRQHGAVITRADGTPEVLGDGAPATDAYASVGHLVDVVLDRHDGPRDGALVGRRAVEILEAGYRSAALDGRNVHRNDLYNQDGTSR